MESRYAVPSPRVVGGTNDTQTISVALVAVQQCCHKIEVPIMDVIHASINICFASNCFLYREEEFANYVWYHLRERNRRDVETRTAFANDAILLTVMGSVRLCRG